MPKQFTHKDLIVWRKAILLASQVYAETERFLQLERYGLVDQMRRSAVSVVSNIAEGAARGSRADYIRFLNVARGSLAELEAQVCICVELKRLNGESGLEEAVAEVGRMLSALVRRLKERRDRASSFHIDARPRVRE
jgi:four helix bundle protein